MTDREPDDLYDALRERLADYGQEPPAPLWASIRAQLRPPVAPPRLRSGWRQRALLGLLLLVVGVGTWQWRRAGRPDRAETAKLSPTSRHLSAHPARPTTRARTPDAVGTRPDGPLSGASARGSAGPASGQGSSAADAAASAAAAPGSTTAAPAGARQAEAARPAAAARAAKRQAATPGTLPTALLAARGPAGPAEARRRAAAARPTLPDASAALALGHGAPRRAAGPPVGRRSRANNQAGPGAQGPDGSSPVVPKDPAAPFIAFAGKRLGGTAFPNAAARRARAAAPALLPPADVGVAHGPGSESNDASRAATQRSERLAGAAAASAGPAEVRAAWSALRPRRVTLEPGPPSGPGIAAVTDSFHRSLAWAPRRWAVQLLSGPALTYRQLGAKPGYEAASTADFYDLRGVATTVAQQERPALGFGAEVQVRRTLSGRWAVSTGLGYHTYAATLAFRTTPVAASAFFAGTASPPRVADSAAIRSYHLRDAYRFLTVPVRASYQVGVGGPHLRVGVLAGAELAWYLSGASTEGSACGCETRTWGRTGSPYRPLSLALNVGLDLRYRLAPRWELLAQPTATYFLNSLARPTATNSLNRPGRPASELAPRHLLGGGVRLGVAYELR